MPAKQQEIEISGPGVVPVVIEEIEQAANDYVLVRDQRMELTRREVALKTNLIQTVLAHADALVPGEDGTKRYYYDDLVVILKPGKPNVKVRSESSASEEVEDDED